MLGTSPAESVDILLVLEGTFPYVRGGVSSWVNRLITGFSEYQFGIIFLGSMREEYTSEPYPLPENVKYYAEYFLYDVNKKTPSRKTHKRAMIDLIEKTRTAHNNIKNCPLHGHNNLEIRAFATNFGISEYDFYASKEVWEYILSCYSEISDQPSFVDYFWTIRGMHAPLWFLQNALNNAPSTRIVHCPSTGYAGYLGSLLSNHRDCPLVISEHGIYTKERRIGSSSFQVGSLRSSLPRIR
ncbi:hypothetical protein B1757_00200 [Acidithiobacillus marinus]|uniref:DUF3492 domain-containing protein n=1 Tax=Acidithiobacillus marinus TaxID=187490 RepID=A0A2I1DQP4_9PROT|nr:GT4 family glycosyltransferase PelF [Acidithiobacillus marinus]PKY12204.1 hypothetical protein B1757_00200 [Acidithiobacillus marinus]